MLQKIRELATGWIAGLIVGALILSFALFGIGSYFSESTEPFVAKVNDTEIKQSAYQRAFYNVRQRIQESLGTQVDPEDEFVKKKTVDRLVDSEIISQIIEDSKLNATDAKVVETINTIELFQDDDGFDENLYQRSIDYMGMDTTTFETQVKLDMLSEQIQSAVSESAFNTAQEIENLVRLKQQQRDFSYVMVSSRNLAENIEPTEDEIEAFYQSHLQEFQQPEQVKVSYIDLTMDKVKQQVTVTEEAVKNYYGSNATAYDEPEKRQIQQIKIAKPADAPDEQKQKADAKAAELLEVIKGDETFETIAETYSSSSNDKVKVDISESGLTARGTWPTEIDEAAFAMEIGSVSEVIQGLDAIFIIKLIDIKEQQKNEYADVRDKVEQDLISEIADKRFYELADQLATLAFEHLDTLEVASDAIEIPVEESDYFTRAGADLGIFSNSRVVEAAFSSTVKEEGSNSDPLEIEDARVVILRLADRIDAGQKELDEVKDNIKTNVIKEKASQQAAEIGQKLLDASADAEQLQQVIADNNLELKQAEAVARDDINTNRSVLRMAFALNKSADQETVVEGMQLGNGDYALVLLKDISYPDSIMGKDIADEQKYLQEVRSKEDWEGFFEQVKTTSDIQIVEENL